MFWEPGATDPEYTDVLELDLGSVQPSVAGPKRPQDRLLLGQIRDNFNTTFKEQLTPEPVKSFAGGVALLEAPTQTEMKANEAVDDVHNGAVVLAAITSCTNTSNPSVLLAAGLVAKKAVEKGLMTKPWVKTSLAPGSRVAGDIYVQADLMKYMEALNFYVVGYGCTTCIGNSGPLPAAISQKVNEDNLVVCSVLSGNRNFEGRIGPDIKANYLMSPPLVVAYALAGTMNIDLYTDPLGNDKEGNPVYLKDIWPSQAEVAEAVAGAVSTSLFNKHYADVFKGDEKWQAINVTGEARFDWDDTSTYIKNPPYFEGMTAQAPTSVNDLHGMKVLALLGDSVTTDHISPAGSIKANTPGGQFLISHGVDPKMFNSYGSRRGNDDVMVRGTFANIRLRNQLAPGTEGGYTTFLPTGEVEFIYDAAMKYKVAGTPLLVIAGKEYGTGSSRDWAAKGTFMLGIKAVLAETFERIHRSNLVGMGVLPLEFTDGQNAASLGLTGKESFDLENLSQAIASDFKDGKTLTLKATSEDGSSKEIKVKVRIDTPQEVLYYVNGGILQYVLRQLLND